MLGAGVLLTEDTVLTCAHTIDNPDERVLVDLVGLAGAEAIPACVAENGWRPAGGDSLWGRTGDLALLRLERPLSAKYATPLLRQTLIPDRRVRVHGFPRVADAGLTLRGELVGPTGTDGRWTMAPAAQGEEVRHGFSGAAVVDQGTGHVIGIVAGRLPDRDPLRHAIVIPTATVLRHLPQLDRTTQGPPAVEPGMRSESPPRIDRELADLLFGWLRGGAHVPAIRSELVRPEDEPRAVTLKWALGLADPEAAPSESPRRAANAPPPAGLLPVDSLLVLDLTQDTAPERVAERISQRVSPRDDRGDSGETSTDRLLSARTLPLTVVVNGVDRSTAPERIATLLGILAERGSRLLLVFHAADGARRAALQDFLDFRAQLGALDQQVEETISRGRRMGAMAGTVTPGSGTEDVKALELARSELTRVHGLQASLETLRGTARVDAVPPASALAKHSRAEASARHHIDRATDLLAPRLDRRDELRGRLEVERAWVAKHLGPERDLELSELFGRAHDLLWGVRCDVEAAEPAVRRYEEAVRGRRRERGEEGRER